MDQVAPGLGTGIFTRERKKSKTVLEGRWPCDSRGRNGVTGLRGKECKEWPHTLMTQL